MAVDCFPDGTPVDPWFAQTEAPALPDLGTPWVLTEHGVAADGGLQTTAIQRVIDRCAAEGGGVIVVPAGTFSTGALFFPAGVKLYLAEGAVLLGSDDISDYPVVETRIEGESCRYFAALINADRADGFTICGGGAIDGNGLRAWKAFWLRRQWNPACTNKDEQRPRLVYVSRSSHVTIAGVTLRNAAFWTNHLYRCDHVKILDCVIYSPAEPVRAPSTDAIDLDACRDVLVKGCDIHVNDDAVALKGGKGPWADEQPENGANERIIIEDCHYRFCHGCLTCGSEAVHCRNIILRRITVDEGFNLLWLKLRPDTPQRYEYITAEDITGRVDHFFQLRPWTQFFDLKGRTDKPLSTVAHVTLRRCRMRCGVCWDCERDDARYRVTDIRTEELAIDAAETGNPFWAADAAR